MEVGLGVPVNDERSNAIRIATYSRQVIIFSKQSDEGSNVGLQVGSKQIKPETQRLRVTKSLS